MILNRLLPAFCGALSIHLLVIFIPYITQNPLPPQLAGNTSIQINLASTSSKNIEYETPNDELEEMPKESPPEQKDILEDIVEAETLLADTVQAHAEILPPKTVTTQASQQSDESAQLAAAAQVTAKTTPLYDKNPKPAYPTFARKRYWQGTVILAILVLENGTVGKVVIHKSSGHEMLDNSALQTVKTWRFVPAMKNGAPVPMEVQVPILFKLD